MSPPARDADIAEDDALVARAVDDLTRRTRFPVAFGGMLRGGAVHVSAVAGARTHNLDALIVETGRGLGGRAAVESRPRLALDYRSAKGITHDYDRMVLGEGIATLFAVPVMVSGVTRGILYCGSWGQSPADDYTARPAFAVAGEVADELRIRDEVRRRVAAASAYPPSPTLTAGTQEELRAAYAELRGITAGVRDTALRERLAALEGRLAALGGTAAPTLVLDVPLSPRETDVIAAVALGGTNAEIGRTLGLKEATVKSYLAAAMAKLNAPTRHAAVVQARRAGILP